MTPALIQVMQDLYASEINCSIESQWDAGWAVKLGDPMNGYVDEANFENSDLDSAAIWLIAAAKKHFPQSQFAQTH